MVAEMGRDVEARQAMDAGQQEAGQDHERADQTPVDQTPVDQTPAEKTRRMPRTKNPDSTGDKSNGAASGANVPKSPPRAVVIASPLAEQEAVSQRLMEAQKLADLGLAHQHLGRLDDAVVSLRDALQITAEVFGPDAERLAPLYDMLANVEQMRGFADEAGHYQKRATALRAPREERRAV